jgi:SUKH-4 immunity protein
MVVTPEDFARAWGANALVRPPAASVPEAIPSDARAFLVRAGLPALIRCFGGSSECKITFCRLASGPSPVLAEQTVGPPLPREWSVYWVLGDEFFCNGAAWWCIHERTGQVERIDIELAEPIEFANNSVAHFASAVLAALVWSSRPDRSAAEWPSEVNRLTRQLAVLDPASMESGRNFWPVYLDYIREEGPQRRAVERGSLSEGERALQAGPW